MNDPGTPAQPAPDASASEDSIVSFLGRLGLTDATGTAPSPTAGILWSRLPVDGSSPSPSATAPAQESMATPAAPAGSVDPIPTLLRRLATAGSGVSTASPSQAFPTQALSLACGGARVAGLILPRDGWSAPGAMSALEDTARAWRLETLQAFPGDPLLPSDLVASQASAPVFGLVFVHEEAESAIPPHFGAEGDVVLLLETPSIPEAAAPDAAGATSEAVDGIRGTSPASRYPVDAARLLGTSVLGLGLTGALRSARVCGMVGLGVTLAEACFGPPDLAAGVARSIGARIDLTGFTPDGSSMEQVLFGDDTHRVLATSGPLDATKTLERARLLGLSAQRIGVVGGDQLVFHTAAGEFAVSLADLRSVLPRCVVSS